jgi:Protein of unknown function (DUF1579)
MSTLTLSIVAALLSASALVAQQPSANPQAPRGQMPDLGRPTKGTDPLPLFDFDQYFVGKWAFEWEMPEGPLGPAGLVTGTTTYKALEGRFYEAITEGTGPAGRFTTKELIAYHRENKTLVRHVSDSRGFSFMEVGQIGGDLGGYYNIYYESAPFTYDGKTIRLRSAMRLFSPTNYKLTTTVSADGAPFLNYGNPWWRKEGT